MALPKKKKKNLKLLPFNIYIKLAPTSERFLLKNVNSDMKVRELKCYAELVVGIPSNLQRLQYLDEGDMMDDSDLKYNDVVAGATINLKIWRNWESLVAAAAKGDVESVFKQDVISKHWEKLDPLLYQSKVTVASDRAAVALFIAAHRGNSQLIRSLIDNTSANVNMKTPFGRSPLHVAASQGHSLSIDVMLEKGATIDEADAQGKTPLMIASQCGYKDSERHLFLFQWQQRAAKIKSRKRSTSLMMHQQFDSSFPIWFKGTHAQLYYCQTLPPGEFAGTGLNAPRRKYPLAPQDFMENDGSEFELPPIDERGCVSHVSPMSTRRRLLDDRRLTSSKSRSSVASSKSSNFDDWLQAKNIQKKKEQQRKRDEQARKDMEDEMKKRSGTGKSFEDWKQSKQKNKLSPTQTESHKDISLYQDDNDDRTFEMTFQQWLRLKCEGRSEYGDAYIYG